MVLSVILGSVALAAVIAASYRYKWKWGGLSEKTLWDWLQLLIIPAVLAGVAFLLSQLQSSREEVRANQRSEIDRELAADAQDEQALQSYLDGMSQLMLEKKLRSSKPRSEMRTVARTRTLSVVRRLDGQRKGILLRFLAEAQLITAPEPVIDLRGADLTGAKLQEADLDSIDLSGADLGRADLRNADLLGSRFRLAILDEAQLDGANLFDAVAHYTSFKGAHLLNTNLSGVDLAGARFIQAQIQSPTIYDSEQPNLLGTDFTGASLRSIDFKNTYMENVKFDDAQLTNIRFDHVHFSGVSFERAVMPKVKMLNIDGYDLDCKKAILQDASLERLDFSSADFTDADLTGATLTATQFDRVVFTNATMPDGSRHK